MVVDTVREEQAIRQMTERLVENYTETYSPDHIESAVGAARQKFEGRPVRQFVPILIERLVRRELEKSPEAEVQPTTVPMDKAPQAPAAAPGKLSEIRGLLSSKKRFAPYAVGAVVVLTVIAVVLAVRQPAPEAPAAAPAPAAPLTVVHGVVGSEKMPFFSDPKVIDALARNGVRVEVEPAGSRQIATSIDLTKFDFAFPSSEPAAERIQRQRNVTAKYTPFSSPMAVATFAPITELLTRAGAARPGQVPTLDLRRYLELVRNGTRWDELPDNTAYPVRKNILISTTDPRSSNSAAMYVAAASYVANNNTIVQGQNAEQAVLPAVSRLFVGQGYTENTTEGPFNNYLATGMGPTPMAWIYEAQYVEATVRGQIKPEMTLLYPSPTVLSRHTLVPFGAAGDRLGRLLSTDPELQRLAAEHGFRTNDGAQFAKVVAERNVPVAPDLLDVVATPTYDTLEHLLDGVTKSYN
ncbi:three-helix bundle dimerization domain-containing protein [Nocardia sp. NPDC059691]|uniref:three-helix bundle dimerization domain-containing protein n=1 Tax=Nocardia sp. NPDC059691 TaxID=3346908 RepID=UPI00368A8426